MTFNTLHGRVIHAGLFDDLLEQILNPLKFVASQLSMILAEPLKF